MKALVFGINGMDGKTLTHFLLSKGYDVVGTYRRTTINMREDVHALYGYDPRLSFEYCDITDFGSVKTVLAKHADQLGGNDIKEIYLLAAQSHVGFSFDSPDTTAITNGMSVFNVLENVRVLCPDARTYFAATSELFGGADPKRPYDESSPYDCRSPYSIGKEMGTRWVKYYRNRGLFACYGILFNHSNVYRSRDFLIRRVTSAAARIALGAQQDLTLGNLDFWRDEHWADFGCEMMWAMLQRDEPRDYVIANGVTHHGETYLDVAFKYFNLDWHKHVKIDKGRFRPSEVVKLIGDSSAAQRDLGWRPNRLSFTDHISLMCGYDYKVESNMPPVRPDVFTLYP